MAAAKRWLSTGVPGGLVDNPASTLIRGYAAAACAVAARGSTLS
jgi:hypothetical protein